MGVSYNHHLIPSPRNFYPNAEQLFSFLEALEKSNWIKLSRMRNNIEMNAYAEDINGNRLSMLKYDLDTMSSFLKTDIRLIWSIKNLAQSGLCHPLTFKMEEEIIYYDFEIHLSQNYIYRWAENVDYSSDIRCDCGEDLCFEDESDSFCDTRIWDKCPNCDRVFDPNKYTAIIRHIRTGNKIKDLKGGLISKFAMLIDCDKSWPIESREDFYLQPELLSLCERNLGCNFDEVRAFC